MQIKKIYFWILTFILILNYVNADSLTISLKDKGFLDLEYKVSKINEDKTILKYILFRRKLSMIQ